MVLGLKQLRSGLPHRGSGRAVLGFLIACPDVRQGERGWEGLRVVSGQRQRKISQRAEGERQRVVSRCLITPHCARETEHRAVSRSRRGELGLVHCQFKCYM